MFSNRKLFLYATLWLFSASMLFFSGCGRQEEQPKIIIQAPEMPKANTTHEALQMPEAPNTHPQIPQQLPEGQAPAMPMEPTQTQEIKTIEEEKKPEAKINSGEIDFDVENRTGKTIYVTCFSYIKKRDFSRWRWDKSDIYRIEDNTKATMDIDTIQNEQDRKNVFGYLGVFNNLAEAQDATFELLPEENQLDVDQLINLQGKKVVIEIEKYGIRGEFWEFDFFNKDGKKKDYTEVDFPVENRTGKPVFVTCFVYEKKAKGRWLAATEDKDDMAVWRFDKTNVIKIMPGELKVIDVDTITVGRDREYLQAYLAVFDEDEEQQANDSVYELLESRRKLTLGPLVRLQNKKIVLEIEKYGVVGDFIDFIEKPAKKIDFTKIIK